MSAREQTDAVLAELEVARGYLAPVVREATAALHRIEAALDDARDRSSRSAQDVAAELVRALDPKRMPIPNAAALLDAGAAIKRARPLATEALALAAAEEPRGYRYAEVAAADAEEGSR